MVLAIVAVAIVSISSKLIKATNYCDTYSSPSNQIDLYHQVASESITRFRGGYLANFRKPVSFRSRFCITTCNKQRARDRDIAFFTDYFPVTRSFYRRPFPSLLSQLRSRENRRSLTRFSGPSSLTNIPRPEITTELTPVTTSPSIPPSSSSCVAISASPESPSFKRSRTETSNPTTNCTNVNSSNSLNIQKMSYIQLLRQLYKISIYSPIKTGLENMHNLDKLLGNPMKGIPVVHVTGTNGKGSVAYKIARTLTASGIRTGLFTSPHISSFKERIQVNYDLITEEDVENILPNLFDLCQEHNIPATFFEITTALAFVKFQRAQCEAVVLEVGIGGRLDATNIITPQLSIITTVQMDHMAILGDTIEKIAREKAGIIKPGVDALVGPGCPYDVMKEKSNEVSAPLFTIPEVLNKEQYWYNRTNSANLSALSQSHRESEVITSIFNDTEILNTDIARAGLHLLQRGNCDIFRQRIKIHDPYIEDCLKIRPPCRYEEYSVITNRDSMSDEDSKIRIILDIAHNEDAIKALVKRTKLIFPCASIRVVIGMSADKAISKCLPSIGEVVNGDVSKIYCTRANHPRAIAHADLRRMLNDICQDSSDTSIIHSGNDGEIRETLKKAVTDTLIEKGINTQYESIKFQPSVTSSIHVALSHATSGITLQSTDCVILVCGSAFVMSDARAELGVVEPYDGDIMGSGSDSKDKK